MHLRISRAASLALSLAAARASLRAVAESARPRARAFASAHPPQPASASGPAPASASPRRSLLISSLQLPLRLARQLRSPRSNVVGNRSHSSICARWRQLMLHVVAPAALERAAAQRRARLGRHSRGSRTERMTRVCSGIVGRRESPLAITLHAAQRRRVEALHLIFRVVARLDWWVRRRELIVGK